MKLPSVPVLYVFLAGFFGLATLVINPPSEAPDECDHFYRAFQLSEGHVIGRKVGDQAGDLIPKVVVRAADMNYIPYHPSAKMRWGDLKDRFFPLFSSWRDEPRVFCPYPHTVGYPPIDYVPQVAAIWLGRLLHLNAIVLSYLARLSVLVCSVLLVYAALKTLPCFQWTFLLLALGPMSLYLMGSIAPDGLVIGGSFLLAAWSLKIGSSPPGTVDSEPFVAYGLLAAFLAVAKVVYFPLCLCVLFLGAKNSTSRRTKALGYAVFPATAVAGILFWGLIYRQVWVPGRPGVPIDPHAQLIHVLGHPLEFLALVATTLKATWVGLWWEAVGILGWLDTLLPVWFYPVYSYAVIACAVLEATQAPKMPVLFKGCLLFAAGAAFLAICLAQYVDWTAALSNHLIEGLEGRYFLPLLPFLAIALRVPVPQRFQSQRLARPVSLAVGLTSGLTCLYAVFFRFWR